MCRAGWSRLAWRGRETKSEREGGEGGIKAAGQGDFSSSLLLFLESWTVATVVSVMPHFPQWSEEK